MVDDAKEIVGKLTEEEQRLFNVGHSFARQMGGAFVIDQRKLDDFRTYRRALLHKEQCDG